MERIRPLLFFGDSKDLQAMIGPLKNALSDQRLKAKALVEVGSNRVTGCPESSVKR